MVKGAAAVVTGSNCEAVVEVLTGEAVENVAAELPVACGSNPIVAVDFSMYEGVVKAAAKPTAVDGISDLESDEKTPKVDASTPRFVEAAGPSKVASDLEAVELVKDAESATEIWEEVVAPVAGMEDSFLKFEILNCSEACVDSKVDVVETSSSVNVGALASLL